MSELEKCRHCDGRGFIMEPGEPSIGDYKISCGYCNGTGIAKGAPIVAELAAFRARLAEHEAREAALVGALREIQQMADKAVNGDADDFGTCCAIETLANAASTLSGWRDGAVRDAALEEAAKVADREADDWRTDDREYWSQGFQDGAMEVASAIRELKGSP